ncbi:MAG TPA: oligosaccharide flippase family protein [Actinomycetota bacterium]|nr:oligosaccharide flippase family protein [Actinomycetota bacterium]
MRVHAGMMEKPFWTSRTWIRKTIRVSFGLWASAGLALATAAVMARSLGPSRYGGVVLALSITTLGGMFLDVTLEDGLVRFGFLEIAENRLGRARGLVRAALKLDLTIGIAIFLLILVSSAVVSDALTDGEVPSQLIQLAALNLLFSTANGTTAGVLSLARRPDLAAVSASITNMARFLGVLAVSGSKDPALILLSYSSATGLGAAVQGFLGWREGNRIWGRIRPQGSIRIWAPRLLKFGLRSSFATTVSAAHDSTVPVVLGWVAGPTAVAMMRVASLPLTLSSLASGPLRLSAFPEQARLSASGKLEDLEEGMRLQTLWGVLLGIPAAIIGYFILPRLLPLIYSEQYVQAIRPAQVLLVGAVVLLTIGWAKGFLVALGQPGLLGRIVLFALAVQISLLLLFGRMGALGGAIAVSATYVVLVPVWWVVSGTIIGSAASRGTSGNPPQATP